MEVIDGEGGVSVVEEDKGAGAAARRSATG
jgi:hypothetical protein